MILDPCVQLLKVVPELRVCIQHNSHPVECFTLHENRFCIQRIKNHKVLTLMMHKIRFLKNCSNPMRRMNCMRR